MGYKVCASLLSAIHFMNVTINRVNIQFSAWYIEDGSSDTCFARAKSLSQVRFYNIFSLSICFRECTYFICLFIQTVYASAIWCVESRQCL